MACGIITSLWTYGHRILLHLLFVDTSLSIDCNHIVQAYPIVFANFQPLLLLVLHSIYLRFRTTGPRCPIVLWSAVFINGVDNFASFETFSVDTPKMLIEGRIFNSDMV